MNVEASKSSKRWWKGAVAGAAGFLVLVICGMIASRGAGSKSEMAKLRASGLPVQVDDLNAWYPAVAVQSNAALRVLAASELRKADRPPASMPKRGEQVTAKQLEEIGAYVAKNTEVIEALRAGLRLPKSRYPLTLNSGTSLNAIPNARLGEVKALAQLLHYEAVDLVAQGRADAAFAPVRDGFAIAGTLRSEPFLFSELVRIACVAIALRSVESALPEGKFNDEQLRQMGEWIDRADADCWRSWNRAIIGERTVGLQHFRIMAQKGGNATTAWDEFRGTLYHGLGFHDRDLRLYLEIMRKFSDQMTNSFPTAYQKSVALGQELTNRFTSGLAQFAFLSQAVLPAIIKATGKEAALVTSLRCARAAVAIERYRIAHGGELPEDLQGLVPKYLTEIPRDGAKGDAIQLEQINGGYRLFSAAAAKLLDNKKSTEFPVVHGRRVTQRAQRKRHRGDRKGERKVWCERSGSISWRSVC